MNNLMRLQLIGMALLLTATGAELLREGVTQLLWASVLAVGAAVCVLAWRWRLKAVLSVPSVDELYALAISLSVVLLVSGGMLWLRMVNAPLYHILAHGLLLGWFITLIAERIDHRRGVQNVAEA
ncbi:hypothetical protein [Halovenus sp.]|uniref:hypothetical protein n=1 Tax=Halovenus halobia TaxID=3396622 RepID=UPI002623C423